MSKINMPNGHSSWEWTTGPSGITVDKIPNDIFASSKLPKVQDDAMLGELLGELEVLRRYVPFKQSDNITSTGAREIEATIIKCANELIEDVNAILTEIKLSDSDELVNDMLPKYKIAKLRRMLSIYTTGNL